MKKTQCLISIVHFILIFLNTVKTFKKLFRDKSYFLRLKASLWFILTVEESETLSEDHRQ